MQKSIKSLKRNGILLLAYDLLVLCIVFVKNGMINMSAEAATSLIVSIGFGIFINLLWIVDSKTWITDYGKRKCIWSYWCGEIVLLLLVVALENMNQLVATLPASNISINFSFFICCVEKSLHEYRF